MFPPLKEELALSAAAASAFRACARAWGGAGPAAEANAPLVLLPPVCPEKLWEKGEGGREHADGRDGV